MPFFHHKLRNPNPPPPFLPPIVSEAPFSKTEIIIHREIWNNGIDSSNSLNFKNYIFHQIINHPFNSVPPLLPCFPASLLTHSLTRLSLYLSPFPFSLRLSPRRSIRYLPTLPRPVPYTLLSFSLSLRYAPSPIVHFPRLPVAHSTVCLPEGFILQV